MTREEGSITLFQSFCKLKETPPLDEFIETFITYSSDAKAERLLRRLYDEGYWLLAKEINAYLLKFNQGLSDVQRKQSFFR